METVKIEELDVVVTEHNGQRVLTTQQLAEAYGTDENNIKVNFKRNKDKYIENKHYICLTGQELKNFKNWVTNCNLVKNCHIDRRTPKIYLWTEKGCLLHAKSLNTDKAWEVYDYLIDYYFRSRELLNNINNTADFTELISEVAETRQQIQTLAEELEKLRNSRQHLDLQDAISISRIISKTPKNNINKVTSLFQRAGVDVDEDDDCEFDDEPDYGDPDIFIKEIFKFFGYDINEHGQMYITLKQFNKFCESKGMDAEKTAHRLATMNYLDYDMENRLIPLVVLYCF